MGQLVLHVMLHLKQRLGRGHLTKVNKTNNLFAIAIDICMHDIGAKKNRTKPTLHSLYCLSESVLCCLRIGYLKADQSVVFLFS